MQVNATNKVSHTPTPWVLDGEEVNGQNGGLIADCFDNDGSKEANAEFIVRAVNEYDNLKFALEETTRQKIEFIDEVNRLKASNEALLATLKNVHSYLQANSGNKGLLAEVDGAIAQAEERKR